MPLSIGNATVSGGSNLTVQNSSGSKLYALSIGSYSGQSYSYFSQPSVPMFVAGGTNAAWVAINTSPSWSSFSSQLGVTAVNVGSCYDTTLGRFTAPNTGLYLFTQQIYLYQSSYTATLFAVNGSITARRGGYGIYRICGYGYVANYNTDNNISEIIPLQAGDYVEPWGYGGSATSYCYPAYGLFTGVFVG